MHVHCCMYDLCVIYGITQWSDAARTECYYGTDWKWKDFVSSAVFMNLLQVLAMLILSSDYLTFLLVVKVQKDYRVLC